jgi:hypothetical protein
MKNNQHKKEDGQTLIETIVALFILVMGISAAVGLAVFAFAASTSITKQIVGSGLAREGVEAVKNMRDTNWMLSSPIDNTCYNFESGANDASCYLDWLKDAGAPSANASPLMPNTTGYDIRARAGFNLLIDPNSANRFWRTYPTQYGFNLTTNATSTGFVGYYTQSNVATSGFYRRISVTEITTAPLYDKNTGPMLLVRSQVWWRDKKCSAVIHTTAWATIPSICKVEMTAQLTNWKDYQY